MTHEIWLILLQVAESQKICPLMGLFCQLHIKFQLKNDRRITSQVNWRETDILFEKSHEKFGEF